MELKSINASLEVTDPATQESVTLLEGDLEVSVFDTRIVESDHMEELTVRMNNVVAERIGDGAQWTLLMAYEGRCWYLTPNGRGVGEIGYYDITTVEGWKVLAQAT
tara:strand:+ start:3460 stop:3777 length:318 start_codon:yes stop_codon:yes gene_type:complete